MATPTQKRERFKKLTDLFVQGTHVELPDGSYLWVKVLNTYERDECLSMAQVARSRLIMALKEKGEERLKVEGHMAEVGMDAIAHELADVKVEDIWLRLANQVRDDPEWAERVRILDETDTSVDEATLSVEERELIAKLQDEFASELDRRRGEERELALSDYQSMDDEQLEKAYLEAWLDKRGSSAGSREFGLAEIALSTFFSDATEADLDGDHGTGERVFETTGEVRHAPSELQDRIRAAIAELNMSERDPKDSGSRPASSDSSPTPNEPAGSTPSTSSVPPQPAPGTSSQPSPTP